MLLTLVACFLFVNFQIINSARVTKDPEDVRISVGEDASFSCNVKLERNSQELTYEVGWYSGNIVIASGHNILIPNQRYSVEESTKLESDGLYVTTTLKIAEVKHADDGTFTCYIIDQPSIEGSARLIVKLVPVPQCMDLPTTVTKTDRLTLSCMIGAGNYDTRLTWYEGDETQGYIESRMTYQSPPMKSFLNGSINVHSYANGTIFKCTAVNSYGEEECLTNPLNIVENVEETSLDVKVESVNTFPLIAGSQACFKCIATCKTGTCVGLISYSWQYFRTVSFLPITTPGTICFSSVSLEDNGKKLRCTARHSESGSGELILEVVDNMATTKPITLSTDEIDVTKISSSFEPENEKVESDSNSSYIPIAIVIIILIFIVFGLIGFYLYHKRKAKQNDIMKTTDNKQKMSNLVTKSGSLNNQQQTSLNSDVAALYTKVQTVNNLAEKPINVEINQMYESVGMHDETPDKSNNTSEEINLYAKVNKNNQEKNGSPKVTHWKSPSGDVYACVQKNRASTLPANQSRRSKKGLSSTKPKVLRKTVNYDEDVKVEIESDELAESDGKRPNTEYPPIKPKNSKKLAKFKSSTMSSPRGHDVEQSAEPQGLLYAEIEFENLENQPSQPQTTGVIYADINQN